MFLRKPVNNGDFNYLFLPQLVRWRPYVVSSPNFSIASRLHIRRCQHLCRHGLQHTNALRRPVRKAKAMAREGAGKWVPKNPCLPKMSVFLCDIGIYIYIYLFSTCDCWASRSLQTVLPFWQPIQKLTTEKLHRGHKLNLKEMTSSSKDQTTPQQTGGWHEGPKSCGPIYHFKR